MLIIIYLITIKEAHMAYQDVNIQRTIDSPLKVKRTIYREPENPDQVRKIFDLWWRKRGLEFLYHRTDQWYFSVKKYGIPYPRLFLRKMKSLWGSCSVTRNKITFNFYLLSQEADCIDYVVLHELIHFRYPNHSREFYAYLESLMPDWRERKNRLNQSS